MSAGTPCNLPVQLTSFVGRERELGDLSEVLGTTRLLTLTGPGGCGKTRLALRMAADMVDDMPDGVWFIELAPLVNPDLVLSTTARAIGVRAQPGRPLIETLVASLGSNRALLLLDNCEHLIDAAADLASRLLQGCPNLLLLATSRAALHVEGERVWRVPELAQAERLFVERASLVDTAFTLTDPAVPALTALCRRLDRMPLAIELAAARARTLSVEEILARLEDSFRFLTSGGPSRDLRHRTLKATIEWSHDLLDHRQTLLFRRMAVFAGGCRLESAEAVCAGGELSPETVLDDLERLVDQSLLVVDRRGGITRFRMLETVQRYANERLAESGESISFRQRHAEHFLSLAEKLKGSADLAVIDTATRGRLDEEEDNSRAALTWLLEHDPHQALRLAVALGAYWHESGSFTEGRAWLLAALGQTDEPSLVRAHALTLAALMSHRLGEYGTVWELGEEARAIYTQLGDRLGVAQTLNVLGFTARGQGDPARARSMMEQALEIVEELGHVGMIATLKTVLATQAIFVGDLVRAERLLSEYLAALAPESLMSAGHGWFFVIRGLFHMRRGEVAQAHSDYMEAVRRFGPSSQTGYLGGALEGLAGALAAEGRATAALRLAGAASAIYRRSGYRAAPDFQAEFDRWITPARRALQATDAEIAWAEGQAMTPEQAVALALEVGADSRPARPAASGRLGGLTRRQLEVAAMVAEGLTNRQIADRLVIAERTAEGHVEQIRNKLGFNSRSQVAAWAADHGVRAPT